MGKLYSHFSSIITAVLLICMIMLSLGAYAPAEPGKLTVTGKVKNFKGKGVANTLILITDSTGLNVVDSIYSNEKGRYTFSLAYNKTYRAYYIKEHYLKMFSIYNTSVPKTKLYRNDEATFSCNLLADTAEVNRRAAATKAFSIISYNKYYDSWDVNSEKAIAFLDEVIKPNVGEMILTGVFKDSLTDSFNVKIRAEDTLGLLLSETQSKPDGSYSIKVPLETTVNLKFESFNHFNSFAVVNTDVPDVKNQDEFKLEQDFTLVSKSDSTINQAAFDEPIAKIAHSGTGDSFAEDPYVAKRFNNQLLKYSHRLAVSGIILDSAGESIAPVNVQVRVGDDVVDEVNTTDSTYSVKLPYNEIVHVTFRANDFHETFLSFNTNIHDDHIDNEKKIEAKVELKKRENLDVNPLAFQYPMAKYYYSEKEGDFLVDSSITQDFLAVLNQPREEKDTADSEGLVTISGQVFDPSSNRFKHVSEARLRILDQDKRLISAYNTDKKGKYTADLGLNKKYFIEVEKEGYLPTLIRFDTKVPSGNENKILPEHENLDLLIVNPESSLEGMEGETIDPEFMNQKEVTAFYYSMEESMFVEDSVTYANFSEDVIAHLEAKKAEKEIKNDSLLAKQKEASRLAREQLEAIKARELAAAAKAAKELETKTLKIPQLRIAGKVVDEGNIPLEGISVALYEGRKKVSATKTDSLGNYNIEVPVQRNMKLHFDGKNLYQLMAKVNTKYPDSLEPESEIITLPNAVTHTTSNVGINSEAYYLPWQSIAYDSVSNRFVRDNKTEDIFVQELNKTPDNQYVLVDGRAKDQNGRNLSNSTIYIRANGSIVDSVKTDKKGRYKMRLEYQKDYRLDVKKQGYHSTFAAVSTKTQGKGNLVDKRIKNFHLLLVNKKESNIDSKVFYKPYAQVAYDERIDEFVDVAGVTDEFLAGLYIEQETKNGKKEYQLKSTGVSSDFALAERKSGEAYLAPVGASTESAKRAAQNRSQGEKSAYMGSLHDAISGFDGGQRARIKNVSLSLEQIYDARKAFNSQQKRDINEGLAEAAEQRELMSNIIAQALGMRRTGDLVSTDSTFNVNLIPRIKHIDEGSKVYQIHRDQVFVEGKMIEYVETWDWFVWPTRYRNNEIISESVYTAELDSIKKIGHSIN